MLAYAQGTEMRKAKPMIEDDDEYRLRPWLRPGWSPSCAWPRRSPIDYRAERTWYPVICRPERTAADWLERSGYRPYWPHYTKHRHRKDGKQAPFRISVISGLIFVPMEPGKECFEAVRSLPGVLSFITIGGYAQALSEVQIGRIREIEGELNTPPDQRKRMPDWAVVGQKVRVRVVGDEHWDLSGPILAVAAQNQISVEVMMLGSRRPITVPVSQVEPI